MNTCFLTSLLISGEPITAGRITFIRHAVKPYFGEGYNVMNVEKS